MSDKPPIVDGVGLRKGRRYVDDPSEAPDDVEVHEGPQGGLWYDPDEAEGNDSEGDSEWDPVPPEDEIDAFETFDGKELLVDGEVYTGSVYLAVDGEVLTEEGPNIPLEDIDGIRDPEDEGEEWELEPEELDYGPLDDVQIMVDGEVYDATTHWREGDDGEPFIGVDADLSGDEPGYTTDGGMFDGFRYDAIEGVREADEEEDAGEEEESEPEPEEDDDPEVELEPFDGDIDELHGDLEPGQKVELTDPETGESFIASVSESHSGDAPYTVFTSEDAGTMDTFGDFEYEVTAIEEEGGVETYEYDPDEHAVSDYLEDGIHYDLSPEFEKPKDKMIEYGSEYFERADEEVRATALNHIDRVEETATGRSNVQFAAGSDRDQAPVRMARSARADTHNHELGHLVADAYGFGITTEAARLTDQQYDTDDDNFVEVPPNRRDEFKLTQRDDKDVPERVQRLMDEVNESWEKLQDAGAENADEYNVKNNYSATNAHEFFAQLNEVMHSGRITAKDNMDWYEQNPDLLRAYTDVFEPSNRMKTLIQHLHEQDPETSPYDDDPYPDQAE